MRLRHRRMGVKTAIFDLATRFVPSVPPLDSICYIETKQRDVVQKEFIQLYTRTHDISNIDAHVPTIESVAADIDDAVQAVWPKRHEIRYSKAHVLLLSWADDDLGAEREIKDLKNVFEIRYRFQVEEYRIPSDKPIKNVHQRIDRFTDFDGKDTLLLVYYAGHAMQSNEGSLWFP